LKPLGTDGRGRPEPVPLEQPGCVVGLAEVEQCPAQLLDGVGGADPELVFLEGADEALRAAVALRRADEGG
jgi:hypothetical protein